MKHTLSLVIPVYNEEVRIGRTISALLSWKPPTAVALERVIFVNDGSTDNTVSRIKYHVSGIKNTLAADTQIISYQQNRGKGYAIARGMEASDSDYTLFCDADMSTPLPEIAKFVPAMRRGIDVIVGTRKNGHSTVLTHQPVYREALGHGFTLLSNIILHTWVTDFTCGFKAFSKQASGTVFPALTSNRWAFDAEALFLARKMGLRIQEVAVLWSDTKGSKVDLLKDIPQTLADLMRIRLADFAQTLGTIVRPEIRYEKANS